MPNNLRNIEINGRQLHYVDQGGEGKQPVIIFNHGGLEGRTLINNGVTSEDLQGKMRFTNVK
jgi:hypothetical protein